MIVSAVDLLRRSPDPTDEEIRAGLDGNLCRCTGYENIVRAVRAAGEAMRAAGPRHSVSELLPTGGAN
jgi:carbon-monoxide dehydrogenase small subunit